MTSIARLLLQPANLFLVGVNLVPLLGVVAWDWDAFVLLMLYWLETAVIAFWTVVRVAMMPRGALGEFQIGDDKRPTPPLAMAAFFTAHAGIFMGAHFMFLWTLFSGQWSRKIHGLRDFVDQMVIDTGLWVPLAALFVGHGVLVLWETLWPYLRRRLRLADEANRPKAILGSGESIVVGLYIRIAIMQFTILLGAWFALAVGTAGALVLLVLLKIAVDLGFGAIAEYVHSAWAKAKAESRKR
jgi:hypothetical protein